MESTSANTWVKIESLSLSSNGWVIEGCGNAEGFWLEVQKLGWLWFAPVRQAGVARSRPAWIATDLRLGACPDPSQSVSLRGVLWTRRAALAASKMPGAFPPGQVGC